MVDVVDDYPPPSIIVKSTKIKTHGETWKSSFGDVSSLHWNLIFKKKFPKNHKCGGCGGYGGILEKVFCT